jgi:hypothetical protein
MSAVTDDEIQAVSSIRDVERLLRDRCDMSRSDAKRCVVRVLQLLEREEKQWSTALADAFGRRIAST